MELNNGIFSYVCHLLRKYDYLSNFNLPHIYRILLKKLIFLDEIFLINHMVSKCNSYYMK